MKCKLSAIVYNVEDEIFLRHSNRDAKESFSIIISEERSELMTYFCKFSICKWILKPRIWINHPERGHRLRRKVFLGPNLTGLNFKLYCSWKQICKGDCELGLSEEERKSWEYYERECRANGSSGMDGEGATLGWKEGWC